jgi:AraC-like DNA-binding protein
VDAAVHGICFRTTDPGMAEAACARIYYPHRLTVLHDPARFAMSLSAVRLAPVAAGLLGYAGEVRLETAELETGYEINVPLSGQLNTRSGTTEVCADPQTAAIYRPDRKARLQGWAGGGTLFGLKIERAALEDQLAGLTGTPSRGVIALGARLDLRTGAGRQWWALARSLIALTADPSGPLATPVVLRPLIDSLLAALLYAADHPARGALDAPCARPGPATISRAVELLEDQPELPWTASDLAARAGLSVRGLQAGFAAHVGEPPMAYLRRVRLQRAHADLSAGPQGGPQGGSVAAIASRWGFGNLGRFAADYRARYGRPPSQTLRRGAGTEHTRHPNARIMAKSAHCQ